MGLLELITIRKLYKLDYYKIEIWKAGLLMYSSDITKTKSANPTWTINDDSLDWISCSSDFEIKLYSSDGLVLEQKVLNLLAIGATVT
jgi:hypothetical protein